VAYAVCFPASDPGAAMKHVVFSRIKPNERMQKPCRMLSDYCRMNDNHIVMKASKVACV